MKRKISIRELKQIRSALEALAGVYEHHGIIQVSLALPEPCDAPTREFANRLIRGLKKVGCAATISFILSFSCHEVSGSDNPYEVLQHTPVASPCIRVYNQMQYKRPGLYGRFRKSLRSFGRWLRPNGNHTSITTM